MKLSIGTNGKVEHAEIVQSPADVLSEATLGAVRRWKYAKPEAARAITIAVPFSLTGGGYAFDTSIRPLTFTPKQQSDVGGPMVEGWSEVRVMVDTHGAVSDSLVLKTSGPEFRATHDSILAALKFVGAAPGAKNYEGTAVNALSIRVTGGSQIEIAQAAGR